MNRSYLQVTVETLYVILYVLSVATLKQVVSTLKAKFTLHLKLQRIVTPKYSTLNLHHNKDPKELRMFYARSNDNSNSKIFATKIMLGKF